VSKLGELKSVSTLTEFAALLDTPTRTLIYTLYKTPEASKYKSFPIAKKSDGERIIDAPIGKLKIYQRALANILYECDDEIQTGRRPLSHAFRKGQSIVTNATVHKRRRFVLNLDLENFFPTLTFPRVRGFFIKDQSFALTPECATILAQIACFKGALPQGSPCSPIISDLVTRILDQRLARFAKQHRVTYSRYADDITFSTNEKTFPAAVAIGGGSPAEPWTLGQPLINKIVGSDFSINQTKTRMQVSPSRQMVTGLTVNQKVNVSQAYWRGVRSMCHSLFKTGTYHKPGADPATATTNLRPIRGVLGHVYHVKNKSHIRPLEPVRNRYKNNNKTDIPTIFGQSTHEDFYYYDYFLALAQPLILTEGHTDPVYLRNAIRKLASKHPTLGGVTPGGFEYNVRFFNYENNVAKILKMGGSDPLKHLAVGYDERLKRYDHKPMLHPVIILLDNDSGLSGFSGAVGGKYGKTINEKTTAPFYHLTANLYVIKTPEPAGGGQSCIETLLGADFPKLMAGKDFPKEKEKLDLTKHIRKTDFARKVVAKNAGTIDWSGYGPLLDRIDAVLGDYKPPASPLAGVASSTAK
jgi:RNA-directed DNA polymerase